VSSLRLTCTSRPALRGPVLRVDCPRRDVVRLYGQACSERDRGRGETDRRASRVLARPIVPKSLVERSMAAILSRWRAPSRWLSERPPSAGARGNLGRPASVVSAPQRQRNSPALNCGPDGPLMKPRVMGLLCEQNVSTYVLRSADPRSREEGGRSLSRLGWRQFPLQAFLGRKLLLAQFTT